MQQHTENRCAARKVRDLPRRYVRRSGLRPASPDAVMSVRHFAQIGRVLKVLQTAR